MPLRAARKLFAAQTSENLRQHGLSGIHNRKIPADGEKSPPKIEIDHTRMRSFPLALS
jgi:hypothetical protein